MSSVKLTPASIALAIVIGSLVGPLSQIATGVTADQLADGGYWLDMAAATITAFAATAVGILGLLAAAIGIPLLKSKGEPGNDPTA